MVLENGSAIHLDIVDAFYKAVNSEENQHKGGGINWDFVDADLNLELGAFYATEYLYECFEVLVDNYFA